MTPTRIHSDIGPRNVRSFVFGMDDTADVFPALGRFGITGVTPRNIGRMIAAMDDLQADILPGTMTTPIQFLQQWLPGFVAVVTAARKADDFVGITTAGQWEDEEVVQTILENLGTAVPYGDTTNIPLSSWGVSFERRTVVRFEEGLQAGKLEEARAARININSGAQKREAAASALEINRNLIAFYGYNGGNNRTYGLLNDPNLPAATAFPGTGSGGSTLWADKTFAAIQADIRLMVRDLRSQSGDVIDPEKVDMTMGLASDVVDFLTTTTDQGVSVRAWLTEAYPRIRVVSAPELNDAIAGDNAAYLYAETVGDDASTDDKKTFMQIIPSKFHLVGVEAGAKGYKEDYSNATAGILCKRAFAVVRRYGC